MISTILIPTDFSPASWNATQVGLELSKMNEKARISFLHIYPLSPRYSEEEKAQATPMLENVKERMNQFTSDLSGGEVIESVVLSGNVEKVMLDFIKENPVDLVIVGVNSNGRDNVIGSHTISLIERSGVPVMIVPNRSHNGSTAA